jgi:membrane complex biogenesis BtpA family protein
MPELLERARHDAAALAAGGVDGVIVENFGDTPFFAETVPPETVAAMALALEAVREEIGTRPLGVNVLRNDARAALGLCASTGASFLRVNVHTGAMVCDQGLIQGRAAETLRERERLAPEISLLADVHVKHAVPLGPKTLESLLEACEETWRRGRADALILSGRKTGSARDADDFARVRERIAAPLLCGSGLDLENGRAILEHTDGAIVGTALKREGRVGEPVELERVKRMAELFKG